MTHQMPGSKEKRKTRHRNQDLQKIGPSAHSQTVPITQRQGEWQPELRALKGHGEEEKETGVLLEKLSSSWGNKNATAFNSPSLTPVRQWSNHVQSSQYVIPAPRWNSPFRYRFPPSQLQANGFMPPSSPCFRKAKTSNTEHSANSIATLIPSPDLGHGHAAWTPRSPTAVLNPDASSLQIPSLWSQLPVATPLPPWASLPPSAALPLQRASSLRASQAIPPTPPLISHKRYITQTSIPPQAVPATSRWAVSPLFPLCYHYCHASAIST